MSGCFLNECQVSRFSGIQSKAQIGLWVIVGDVKRYSRGTLVLKQKFQTQLCVCVGGGVIVGWFGVLSKILIIPSPPLGESLKVNSLVKKKMKCKRACSAAHIIFSSELPICKILIDCPCLIVLVVTKQLNFPHNQLTLKHLSCLMQSLEVLKRSYFCLILLSFAPPG